MADNVTIKDANGVDRAIAADDLSSVWFQRMKLDLGGDGSSVPVVLYMPTRDYEDSTGFHIRYEFTAAGVQTLKASVASNKIVVDMLVVSCAVEGKFELVEDPAGTPVCVYGPHFYGSRGGSAPCKFPYPGIELTTATALGARLTTSTSCALDLWGHLRAA